MLAKTKALTQENDYWRGSFAAMASPCEILMDVEDEGLASEILDAVQAEAYRIEQKYSRYKNDNIIYKINHSKSSPVIVDEETARLIDFSDELYQMSDGLFDITSGVLRQAWMFDGSDNVPEKSVVDALLNIVGWDQVSWKNGSLLLREGMEIDLGGIGKEYAVDRCVLIVKDITEKSVLINFGGDLAVSNKREKGRHWSVGRLISRNNSSVNDQAVALFELRAGAIATSGDAHRYLLKDNVRYSHVLNPKTGWPVENAPHTISVAAPTCLEAGMMSTIAMLHGSKANDFLKHQGVEFWTE